VGTGVCGGYAVGMSRSSEVLKDIDSTHSIIIKEEVRNMAETKTAIKFKPLKERVFVSYAEESDKTAGGIYLPDTAKEKPQKGKVEAVGSDVKEIKVGDSVLFDKYSGSKIAIEGNDYLIIKEEDILGIFDK
jgi:chaperonin GroES